MINEIFEIEENPPSLENDQILAQYNYLKRKLKEIEEVEIEGYKRRVKYLAPYEKTRARYSFFFKITGEKTYQTVYACD